MNPCACPSLLFVLFPWSISFSSHHHASLAPTLHLVSISVVLNRTILVSQEEMSWALIRKFSPVAQSCPTLCDPMNCSTPGLSVHHQLPEFIQTHVHRVSDAIQPSQPSVVPFSSCPQFLPASESFPMSSIKRHKIRPK